MKIFENKNYPLVMFLAVIIVCLLILFNFTNIFSLVKNSDINKNSKLTGFGIFKNNESYLNINKTTEITKKQEVYSTTSYIIFFFIILILIIIISIIFARLLLPKIKKFT